ncbi:MAG: hypothetical protein EHM70_21530 [Chloroflexota bacterium]|nr:MAG: hypothetical protein EHM70_21530 [Chloroflexota bacterium]
MTGKDRLKIDLLYFEGCPSWQEALSNLKTALLRKGVAAEIRPIRVEDEAQAAALRFNGSPSFQIDGRDWWPEERQGYPLCCRVYPTQAGLRGAPGVEMLQAKLDEILL